ncbi:MAG TPA: response regulator [Pyrinomonadaceae bacterium]|nr:response regulator [Pyrinomonadaceae bacterium]
MRRKTVVIVEDNEAQRLSLQLDLERRNFKVGSAATAAEAREVVGILADDIDVMVLDMRLEDPVEPNTTGTDIGIELQHEHPGYPPEFLVHSAFAEVNYYKLALRLGAAAYLNKTETTRGDLIRHVRALSLKRALRLDRPQLDQSLSSISNSTKSLSAGIRKFCLDVLSNELDSCLGTPYAILLTDETGTQNCATNTDLPTGYDSVYTSLQAMAHGISNFASPYEVSRQEVKYWPKPTSSNEVKIYERLPGSTFIPLANVQNFRLSLGLFEPRSGEAKFAEETGKLAAVLSQYVRSTIVEHFFRILIHLDSQKRATMLKSTSHLCLSLGEEQQRIIDEGIMTGQLIEGSNTHQKLITMSGDLWDTGTILTNVALSGTTQDYGPPFELKDVVERALIDLKQLMDLQGIKFNIEGSCKVRARPDDIYIAVTRVLQWLAQRKRETRPDVHAEITVRCTTVDGYPQATFEDLSNRLPQRLREQLFLPFSVSLNRPFDTKLSGPGVYLPLYLAKILIEEKYGGWLEDKTDELRGNIGHRIVMRFEPSGDTTSQPSPVD